MIDFHSHILPGIDDGCKEVSESIELLKISKQIGVDSLVFTPHFYAQVNNPQSFINDRNKSIYNLIENLDYKTVPTLYLGAEVYFYKGISCSEYLNSLTIGGSKYILIEMPFDRWSKIEIDEIVRIKSLRGFKPIVAHIERYFRWNNISVFEYLQSKGVLLQSNAELFTKMYSKLLIGKILKNNLISVLGSDCHNLASRTQNMNIAYDYFTSNKKVEMFNNITNNSQNILNSCQSIQILGGING